MNEENRTCEARPRSELLDEIMNSCIPRNKRERVAAEEIEVLRAKLAELESRSCKTCACWLPGILGSGRCAYWERDITAGFSCKAYEPKEQSE
jgi:hypothetical protein